MSSDSESDVELNNLEDDTILNKYKMSAEITQKILKELIKKCEPGSSVLSLCIFGDDRIAEETAKIFKKDKDVKKGVAFPTCISRNNVVCNFSPLLDQTDEIIEKNDMIKIDVGVQVDGYAAVVGHTFVVGASKDNKIAGRKADAILAAYNCAEAALRLIKPGKNNKDVSEPIINTAAEFECKVLENCVVNGFQKDIYENAKTFSVNPSEEQKKSAEQVNFEVNQVWTVDVIVTSGDGKVKERDAKTTVYKRNIGADTYNLKLKASRQFFSDVTNKYVGYPFTLRSFLDQTKAKIAVIECCKHGLVDALPVMFEKEGESVAHFKYTVLLMPNGPMRLTGLPFDSSIYQSDHKIQSAVVKAVLAEPIKNKKKPATAAGETN